MITESEYKILKNKYNQFNFARNGRTVLSPEDLKTMPEQPTADEISSIEVYEFITNPPDKYFLYVDAKKNIVTTWTGEVLGKCYLGRKYKSNMKDVRQSIDVYAINGKKYFGIYYTSAGDYARIKLCKNQTSIYYGLTD